LSPQTPVRVWVISFECGGVAKAGGLGEAVRGYASRLAERGHATRILMPSHGLRSESSVRLGEFTFYRRTVDGAEVIMASNPVLDEPSIYAGGLTEAKAAALARAAKALVEAEGPPDVIHANDWHAVPAALSVLSSAPGTAFIFHVHLYLGWWVSWDYLFRDCGLDPGSRLRGLSLGEAYGRANGVIEVLAAQLADSVVTVSRAYMEEVLRPAVWWAVGDRLTFVYNGTDWSFGKLVEEAKRHHALPELGDVRCSRRELRRYLLTEAIARAIPRVSDPSMAWAARGAQAFPSDGPLVLATGRASWQKGFDVLLQASDLLASVVPGVRFLLLLLPARGEESHLSWLIGEAERRPHVRLIVGHAAEIYALAHLAADAFAVPSRWEPFGLSAVEAMAAGVPVAASGVGGLKETIVDLRSDPSGGTGYLVPPENPAELARALASLLAVTAREDLEASGVLERAESFGLPKPSLSDSELRARCAARAAVFSWAKAAERLEEIYRDALIRARGA